MSRTLAGIYRWLLSAGLAFILGRAAFAQEPPAPPPNTLAEALAAWRARTGFPLIGTSPEAPVGLDALAFPESAAVWMGSERTGLSAGQRAACDLIVRIPMAGRADSLNVASAAAIVLYAASRRGGP